MGRFTNPRDLYFGEGARHEVKNLKGKKAIIVSGGSSMRRGGFLQDVENDLKEGGFEVKLFEGCSIVPGSKLSNLLICSNLPISWSNPITFASCTSSSVNPIRRAMSSAASTTP